ncbi:hypothetical protein [Salinarchaeum laminariae]|uniref:hypothetical protein n=1 Tax=Salinarchaeum laminariae TaxID=869888 RepID=UPI0020BECEF5|nr:hypothetical protein [Salinarchaeum laminariae]
MKEPSRRELLGVAVSALVVPLAGCGGLDDSSEGSGPSPDERLSRSEAAAYVTDYVSSNWSNRDQEAYGLYQDGVTAISEERFSRAIRDLELSVEEYEKLESDAFEKRNEYDENQNRYALFDHAWNMYRLMHESASAWYNSAYAYQVEDDPQAALDWSEEAERLFDESRRHATRYHDMVEEWGEG